MRTKPLYAALAAALAIGFSLAPARALEITEVRGDFYYDAQGDLVGMRHVALPDGFERRSMSHREKFAAVGIQLPDRPAELTPRTLLAKPARVTEGGASDYQRVFFKFVDQTKVRLRAGRLLADGSRMAEVDAILARYPDAVLERLFTRDERAIEDNRDTGERISRRALADLNNFYRLTFPSETPRSVDLANELLALDEIEAAYLPPKPAPPPACVDVAPVTGNWEANQFYLDAAPAGIDARFAWAYHPGGNGPGTSFWVADIEYSWCYGHEDYDADAADVLNGITAGPFEDGNHGCAVLGEIGGCPGTYGVTGISSDVTLRMIDQDTEASMGNCVDVGDAFLVTGEVLLIEAQVYGPSLELLPVEWVLDTFLSIQVATANGIIVVEAGANGGVNLDAPAYGGAFNRAVRDSWAILVGAGQPTSHSPESFTNFGSRIDAHGYGSGVYTTGYGGLFNQAGCTQDYTATFSGTSSASPMIVGASVALQGISQGKYGVTLAPWQMRHLMIYGGTPQGAPLANNIGPMPNLRLAIERLKPDVVPYFTPGGWSYAILPRSTPDTNSGYAPLEAGAIPGNVAATYWNWTEMNESYTWSSTLTEPRAGLFVDDSFQWFCYNANMAPGAWGFCGNIGPDFVKGGRHTILNRSDVFGTEDELFEANDWARQFIWSPLALATNAPVVRSYDPPRITTGWGPYYNVEGFSGATASYWTAFAVLPADASTDHDVYLHTETPMNSPQQGFGASVAGSAAGGHASDFVIIDGNTVAGGLYYASDVDYAGTGNKIVELDSDQGVVPNPGTAGAYTLGAGQVINLHEVYLYGGSPTRIHIEWLGGNANCGLSVHQSPSGFSSKYQTIVGGFADVQGAFGDEYVMVDSNGWHGIAVWKSNSFDANESLTYNVIVTQLPNFSHATPAGWYGPVVPRNTTDAGFGFAPLSPVLDGNIPTTSYNFSMFHEGPGNAPPLWSTDLKVDDVSYWFGVGAAIAPGPGVWINTSQGLDPNSIVRGGRHHIRVDADRGNEVAEIFENDNMVVDWFSWSPLLLYPGTPVTRAAGPPKDPVGYGPDYSCDGLKLDYGPAYWTAVGVLPTSMSADYDVRTHYPYVGSKDGFNGYIDWSGDATDGAVDFAIVNENVASVIPDFSVLNWNASGSQFVVERAEANDVLVANPGVNVYGPYGEGVNDVLDMFEVYVPWSAVGMPIYISLEIVSGPANLGISLYDGTFPYHNKWSTVYVSNSGGPGVDEHLAPVTYGTSWYHGLAVYKTDANDLPLSATYRIVIAVGAPATDAPQVEAAPTAFALSAPRPNPFGSETSIRLDVPTGGSAATVEVFDVHGRRVVTLAEGARPAGRHLLTWKGTDSQGEKVAAGVYFVRLETATLQETKKITLLR